MSHQLIEKCKDELLLSMYFYGSDSKREVSLIRTSVEAFVAAGMKCKLLCFGVLEPSTSTGLDVNCIIGEQSGREWIAFAQSSMIDTIGVTSCARYRGEPARAARFTANLRRDSRLGGPPLMLWIGVAVERLKLDPEKIRGAIDSIVLAVGAEDTWYSGYVEEVRRHEIDSGMVYDTDGCGASAARAHEVSLDAMMGARRSVLVRGLFYGNYFGPRIVQRLGLPPRAIRAFESWSDVEGSRGQYVLETESGGQYWSLGRSPIGSYFYDNGGYGDGDRLAKFLRNRLRSRRLMM